MKRRVAELMAGMRVPARDPDLRGAETTTRGIPGRREGMRRRATPLLDLEAIMKKPSWVSRLHRECRLTMLPNLTEVRPEVQTISARREDEVSSVAMVWEMEV